MSLRTHITSDVWGELRSLLAAYGVRTAIMWLKAHDPCDDTVAYLYQSSGMAASDFDRLWDMLPPLVGVEVVRWATSPCIGAPTKMAVRFY